MRRRAVLLVGPTGAGKTPLGEYVEAHGLWGCRWGHFDFGAQLRKAAGGGSESGLLAEDLEVIRESLRTGAVLEDGQFQIAEKILRHFVGGLGAGDHVLLNGLPRHVGQAKDVDGILGVEGVISLECSAEVVRERIRRNSGGDRTGRVDDDLAAVERKLEVYASRTLPLIEHYRLLGVAVHVVGVGVETSAGEVHRQLSTGE